MDITNTLSDELLEVRSDIVFQDIFSDLNKRLLTLLLSRLLRQPYLILIGMSIKEIK